MSQLEVPEYIAALRWIDVYVAMRDVAPEEYGRLREAQDAFRQAYLDTVWGESLHWRIKEYLQSPDVEPGTAFSVGPPIAMQPLARQIASFASIWGLPPLSPGFSEATAAQLWWLDRHFWSGDRRWVPIGEWRDADDPAPPSTLEQDDGAPRPGAGEKLPPLSLGTRFSGDAKSHRWGFYRHMWRCGQGPAPVTKWRDRVAASRPLTLEEEEGRMPVETAFWLWTSMDVLETGLNVSEQVRRPRLPPYVPGVSPELYIAWANGRIVEYVNQVLERASRGYYEYATPDEKRTGLTHFRWFVQYQLLGLTLSGIAYDHLVRTSGSEPKTDDAVSKALHRLAAKLEVDLRAPGSGGRPKRPT